jgi:hypothetical protein
LSRAAVRGKLGTIEKIILACLNRPSKISTTFSGKRLAAFDYTEQTSWVLFLKYLDGLEQDKADEAVLEKKYIFILDKPYRW